MNTQSPAQSSRTASTTMNAMVFDDYGSADVIHQASVPIPRRLPG
ncbi:hypothetical protein [Neorhodopirellula pilleata]|nr:hypothetical protein [Neorhodopirellula pilleata]